MDEDNLKEILLKSNNDKTRYEKLLDLYLKEESFSDLKIMIFSIGLSGFLTYRFLNKKIILRENYGHFNSPQNLLNKHLTKNFYQDAIFRLVFGGITFYYSLYLLKSNYFNLDHSNTLQNKLEKNQDNLSNDFRKINSSSNIDGTVVEIGVDEISEKIDEKFVKKIFSLDRKLEERKNIQKYYNKNTDK